VLSDTSGRAFASTNDRRARMASNAKKKTTFAKMNRENAVRERRLRKQAKKEARKQAAAAPSTTPTDSSATGDS
jgi:lysozyme family protein